VAACTVKLKVVDCCPSGLLLECPKYLRRSA
jgi:hypothetical protein